MQIEAIEITIDNNETMIAMVSLRLTKVLRLLGGI